MEDWARESKKRSRNEPVIAENVFLSAGTNDTGEDMTTANNPMTMKDMGYSAPYKNVEVVIEGLDR